VVLAQWDVEGKGWPPAFNNPGDVGDPANAGQTSYPSIQAGVDAYVRTMMLSYYSGVRSAVGYVAQSQALGKSPWAAGHYGNPPGSDLISIIQTNSLTQYDVLPPAPTPPSPQEAEEMTSWQEGGQNHIAGEVNNKAYHWWQAIGGNPAGEPTWHVEILPTP
jgi:hypothetical protein